MNSSSTETDGSFIEHLPNHPYNKYAVLRIFISDTIHKSKLTEMYKLQTHKHNQDILNNAFPDSGFDLFVPEDTVFTKPFETQMIDFGIRTEMTYYDLTTYSNILEIEHGRTPVGSSSPFYLYPRSSFSRTPLMLANHTGIVDSGYRGNLLGAFRLLNFPESNLVGGFELSHKNDKTYMVEQCTRLLQICHPSLCPIFVELVSQFSDLSFTKRGDGGFGSTGAVGVSV